MSARSRQSVRPKKTAAQLPVKQVCRAAVSAVSRIGISLKCTVPDDTDRGVIECHSDSNPWITATKTADWEDVNPWTEAWSVAAESDWGETLPYSGKVSVMGGEANPVYIDVTVEEPAYKTTGSSEGLLSGSNATPDAGDYTAP